MSASEPARLALYNVLGEVIGPENAETLMSSLPLQPAVELATKDDIAMLRADVRELRSQVGEIHKAIHQQMRFTIGAMTGLTAIFSLIVGLIT